MTRTQLFAHRQSSRLRFGPRGAFTLLELILALSLTVVVVLTVTMAIDLYWRQFNIRRTNVEEAQLARSLLRHMADDLRCAMQYTPADLSGLSAVAQNGAAGAAASALGGLGDDGGDGSSGGGQNGSGQNGSGQNGGNQNPDNPGTGSGDNGGPMGGGSGTGGQQGGQGQGQNEDDAGSATGGFTDTGEGTAAAMGTTTTVGLYGSATELRLDISRLPRVDQYEALMATGIDAMSVVDIPSDIKTVTYFLRSEESADAAATPLSASAPIESTLTGRGRGLMRREVDRAVTAWSESSGGESTGESRLLAEEVVGLSFQYFDGTQWLTDWDSDQYGGLPLAVEILLVMSDAAPELSESPLAADTNAEGEMPTERSYRLVVRLPTASIHTLNAAANAATEAESGTTGSTTGSTLEAFP